jgi:4-amino-4-deoxy-L-arabinose transferase-like glycosyltransferase
VRVSNGFESPFVRFCQRHYPLAAAIILAIAAFNLFFRLDREIVTEWDESLYAISAAETATHGNWIGTTFRGELDYYNTKPPLNVWLIAASFKAFGVGFLSLRLPSAIAAWLTILVLLLWARRSFGEPVALAAALVLSTTFGFIYVHSGRSGNTDALFTLAMLLVVVTLWVSSARPWRLAWLGPLMAGIFLLRGMAVLMPLVLIAACELLGGQRLRQRLAPLAVAAATFAIPVGAWVLARWQLDSTAFLERMVRYDLVARSARALEGHTGSPLYYLNVLQKDQYDWLLAAVVALVLVPPSRQRVRELFRSTSSTRYFAVVGAAWFGVTLLIPTVMRTKVAWYLNPFFPIFALLVAAAVVHALSHTGPALARRQKLLAALVLLAFAVAEGKLVFYSYNRRHLHSSAQGLLLADKTQLAGRRVFRDRWPASGLFVLEHIVKGQPMLADDEHDFMRKGRPGDYMVLSRHQAEYSQLGCIASNRRYALCRYPD